MVESTTQVKTADAEDANQETELQPKELVDDADHTSEQAALPLTNEAEILDTKHDK